MQQIVTAAPKYTKGACGSDVACVLFTLTDRYVGKDRPETVVCCLPYSCTSTFASTLFHHSVFRSLVLKR